VASKCDSWKLLLKVTWLHGCRWAHIWHFGGLKMRFLAGC